MASACQCGKSWRGRFEPSHCGRRGSKGSQVQRHRSGVGWREVVESEWLNRIDLLVGRWEWTNWRQRDIDLKLKFHLGVWAIDVSHLTYLSYHLLPSLTISYHLLPSH